MKHAKLVGSALLIGGFLLPCGIAAAQDPGKKQEPKAQQMPGQEEMTKKWTEVSTPGDPQKKLEDLAGTWDTETKVWMQGPGSEPNVTKGSSVNSWVLGGRFLRQEYKGEMMGQPFEGIGYTGYDNYNKRYVSFWIDNSTTQMSTMSGTVDKSGKVFTLYGTMDEWMTGENGKAVKYVTRIINRDKNVFEVHDLTLGEPNTKMMEITYTRKK
jgi:hypothetical protein